MKMVSRCQCKPKVLCVNRFTSDCFIPDCKRYACEYCGKLKVSVLRKAILTWFRGQKLRLLTLTTTNKFNEQLGIDLCQESWKVFSRWMRKQEKVGSQVVAVQYVKLRERQRNGQYHFHLIINRFLNWETIQPVWREAVREVLEKKGITVDDIDKIANAKFDGPKTGVSHRLVSWYVTKYVTKYAAEAREAEESYDRGWQRFRPYATSRNVHLFTRTPSTGDWRVYHYQRCSRDQLLYLSPRSLIPQDDSEKTTFQLPHWAMAKLFPDLWQIDGIDFESV